MGVVFDGIASREAAPAMMVDRPAIGTGDPASRLSHMLAGRVLADLPEYHRQAETRTAPGALAEFILRTSHDLHDPADIFSRLRWGGVFAFVSEEPAVVAQLAARSAAAGFAVETGPSYLREGFWRLPWLSRKVHYFIARKVLLVPPGATTERFTYDVRLERTTDPAEPLIVSKQVPSEESVIQRLHAKFPEISVDTIEHRARKFTQRIFPTFLTREAAMLLILQEHLPAAYQSRVPRVISMEKDDEGLVRKLRMSWLRNGGEPLTQMEFARQSADLLRVVHDIARIIHLDLRLDNFVITPDGVGFVDFGSAVRDDEDLRRNPLVGSLFDDLMRTSQIQRMLNQMVLTGHVTSDIIRHSQQRADKALDFFYLAVQFNNPHINPDLVDLIRYDPLSDDARRLSQLTTQILRPPDPANPVFRSAKDILHGIERMQLNLNRRRPGAKASHE